MLSKLESMPKHQILRQILNKVIRNDPIYDNDTIIRSETEFYRLREQLEYITDRLVQNKSRII